MATLVFFVVAFLVCWLAYAVSWKRCSATARNLFYWVSMLVLVYCFVRSKGL